MGNRYIEKRCAGCNKETLHRITRKFGGSRSGKWHLRRTTTTCRSCQFRVIDNDRKKRQRRPKGLMSFRTKENGG